MEIISGRNGKEINMGLITKHKTTLVYKGVKMDSDEEVYVAMWLQELQDAGFVSRWSKAEIGFPMTRGLKKEWIKKTQLKTKIKEEKRTQVILRPSEYTPDFIVNFTAKGINQFIGFLYNPYDFKPGKLFYKGEGSNGILLEVKPEFDQNNMERLFVLNQKFLYAKEKIFVNLVEPIGLFKKTFIPLACIPYFTYKVSTKKMAAKGKQKGDYKFDFKPKILKEWLMEI